LHYFAQVHFDNTQNMTITSHTSSSRTAMNHVIYAALSVVK